MRLHRCGIVSARRSAMKPRLDLQHYHSQRQRKWHGMDANQFDALAKSWASSSRRRLLQGVMAASLSGLGLLQGEEAGANHFDCLHIGKPCRRSGKCCSGRCRGPRGEKTCRAHHTGTCKTSQDTCVQGTAGNECGTSDTEPATTCYCYVTTGGAPFCAQSWGCGPCKKDSESTGGIVPGSACVVCPSCPADGNPDPTAYAIPCANPTV
jgi:hypothetical protein